MEMQYRKAGNSGLSISAISLGAWLTYGDRTNVEEDTALRCIHTAIDHGINFIDVADAYANGEAEATVGRALQGKERHKLVVSTKAFFPMSNDVNDRGLSRKHLIESVNRSLKRLQTDYIDIFFCHRFDLETPIEETIRAISDLIFQGKILYWGTSMWTAPQIEKGCAIARELGAYPPILEQSLYNMLDRHQVEGNIDITIKNNGIGLVVYSPLAGGMLTGKYNDSVPEGSRAQTLSNERFQKQIADQDRLNRVRSLTKLAQELDTTMPALALAWAMKHPSVNSVITGATKPSQIEANLAALKVNLTDEIEKRIDSILANRPEGSVR